MCVYYRFSAAHTTPASDPFAFVPPPPPCAWHAARQCRPCGGTHCRRLSICTASRRRAACLTSACAARSIDRLIVQRMCRLAGPQMLSEPGPMPIRTRRYQEITYCDAPRFVAVHSWTNGVPARPRTEAVYAAMGRARPLRHHVGDCCATAARLNHHSRTHVVDNA